MTARARKRLIAILGGGAVTLVSSPVRADDLREALAAAYRTNPILQAARADQRAVDEAVPLALSAGRPAARASADYSEAIDQTAPGTTPMRQATAGVSLTVPLYSSGLVKHQVRAAERRVEAGQADLRATESAVFGQTVAAYMDVLLNEAVAALNRKNVEVLAANLQATRDRFTIGDLTRTDVAQSGARLAAARSDARSAEANLGNARERYVQVVGHAPGELAPPPPLPGFPASAEEAVEVALRHNPDIVAAQARTRAASSDVDVAGAGRLPQISVSLAGSYANFLGSNPVPLAAQRTAGLTIGLSGSIPLFQGGRPAAERRQAQGRASAALEREIGAERDVIAQVRSAFQSWLAANDLIVSSQAGIDAAALGLRGVRAENGVGTRTILDVLNAEQELLNANVRLVTARRNAYVAGFALLAAMGRAEARDLGLEGGALYDPALNYRRVRGKWRDWDDDPAPIARSTRTAGTAAQDGRVP